VDGITFLLETLDDMMHGGQVILDHHTQFGLILHIDRRGNTSTIESLHIPNKLGEEPIPAGTIVLLDNEAYFHFTEQIKYLGSIVAYCLRDETNIAACVSKADGTMGALKDFFNSREVPLDIKLRLYITKSWAM
jgi:hypothetical protein